MVVRIESATRPDIIRMAPPFAEGVVGLNRSGYFSNFNSDKYSVSLNLNHPRGPEVAKRIIAWADIVLEGFAPGVIDRWGLGYEELKRVKPDIIMVGSSNQGQTGPHAQHPGYGTQLVSMVGFTHITGWPDREPCQPYGAYTDVVTPRLGAAAIIAALDHRQRTGQGQYLDFSQFEASLHFLAPLLLDYWANGREARRQGNSHPQAAPHNAYRCRGHDRWCAIAVFTQEEWNFFCRVIGDPEWTRDTRFATPQARKENEEELDRLVETWTLERSAHEVMALMQSAGVGAGVVSSAQDLLDDPQLEHRHHFWKLDHPEMGPHLHDGPPFQLSRTPAELKMGAPCLGEHNEYIYKGVLGMSDDEFVELLMEGVLE
jgi:crotonobetainyl-CoA:carnitine CoA-transferase CaiB-like acyl-CoA transferase